MKPATESSEQHTNSNGSHEPPISAEMIRAQLEKILSSSGFATAERLSKFLRYTVEESLSGQTDKLKESFLGVEVFGRRPTYDPRMDAVVRTEAVKLRARLKDYYAGEGQEDALFIDLPKGGYVPAFRWRDKTPVTTTMVETLSAVTSSRWRWAVAIGGVVVIVALGWFFAQRRWRADARAPELSSIAVLPFADLSPERNQEYFCDGMTDEIIDALAKVGGFRVVARTSSFAFKGKQQDIREIGRRLGVGAVLEGSVRKDGNRLRVTAQLNSVTDGYHLWSETYERELKDVFALQDEISRSIVDTLQVKLANGPANRLVKPPEDLAAYDLYLQGRYHWSRWRTEGAEKSTHYFEQAIARDPNYGPALAWAAMCCHRLLYDDRSEDRQGDRLKGIDFARRALEVARDDPGILVNAAFPLAYFGEDIDAMMALADRALTLNPNYARGWHLSGVLRLWAGQLDVAIERLGAALRLSPRARAGWSHVDLGAAYFLSRRFDEALPELRLVIQEDPNLPLAHRFLAACYAHIGRLDEARSIVERLRAITPVVIPDASYLRNPEHRELYLSGLRLAAGEAA